MYLWLQWPSSVFQLCKLILDHHWNTTGCYHKPVWFQGHPSVLLGPVVFQCGLSSGILVYWQNLVWRSLGQVISQHATFLCIQLVWWELFELNWFHLTCNTKYTKTIRCTYQMHAQSDVEVLTCVESTTGIHCRAVNSQVKAEFTETCPLPDWCPAILSFQTGTDATLLNYMCWGVCWLLQSLQWCSRVGCKS